MSDPTVEKQAETNRVQAEVNLEHARSRASPLEIAEYQDLGWWARHYSTVRLTIGVLGITLLITLITDLNEKQQGVPGQPKPPALNDGTVWLVWLLGLVLALLFLGFTWATYVRMREQVKRFDEAQNGLKRGTSNKSLRRATWLWHWGSAAAVVGTVYGVLHSLFARFPWS